MRLNDCAVLFRYADIPMIGNTSTGSVVGLTSSGLKLCEKMLHEDVAEEYAFHKDAQLVRCLVASGFVDSCKDSAEHRPISAYLHVTQRCNLSCVGCYSDGNLRNAFSDLPTDAMREIIRQLAETGIMQLIVSGGEPFLRDDLGAILRYAKETCLIPRVVVVTNGTLVSEGRVREIAPYVDQIAVSFDGCTSDSPSSVRGDQRFDQLQKCLDTIAACGVNGHIIATIHAKNYTDIKCYLELSSRLGVSINFSVFSSASDDENAAELLLDADAQGSVGRTMVSCAYSACIDDTPMGPSLAARKSCGAGTSCFSVDADGAIYPCHMLHFPQFKMGNCLSGGVPTALSSNVAIWFRDFDAERVSECRSCEYLRLCGGGCRARGYYASGSIGDVDPYCLMVKTYFRGFAPLFRSAVRVADNLSA